MRALRTFTLLIALASAGTAHAEGKKEPLSAQHAEQLLAFFNELVDTTVKHATNCETLATEVGGVVDRHINTIQMTWAARKKKQTVPKDVQEKLDKRALEMVESLRRCWEDDRVKAVFQRMKEPKPKQ